MNNKSIGIVTVLYNSDGVLPDFFESLALQRDVSFTLYVIDNSPTSSGTDLCNILAKKYGLAIKTIFNNENVGVARGNNQGIELALENKHGLILLANNDLKFTDEFAIAKMTAELERSGVSAVVPKIFFFDRPTVIWCAGGKFKRISATTPHYGELEEDGPKFNSVRPVDYAPTCFMLLNSKVFQELGMMDERYFVYYDDTDFLWRMKAAGKIVNYLPTVSIWHKVSSSTGGTLSEFTLFYSYRNRIFFIRKNYSALNKLLSFIYVYTTSPIKMAKMSRAQRVTMRKGLSAGWSIRLN